MSDHCKGEVGVVLRVFNMASEFRISSDKLISLQLGLTLYL